MTEETHIDNIRKLSNLLHFNQTQFNENNKIHMMYIEI